MRDFQGEIHRLLASDPGLVAGWEGSVFDELAGRNRERLVLCGAGGLGRKTLAGLRCAGIVPLAFADNNPALEGTAIEGIPVYSPAEAVRRFGGDAVFVVTIWGAHSRDRLAQRKQQLRELGAETVVSFMSLFWKFPEYLLPHYSCDLPHKVFAQAGRIESLADLWGDETSRQEFLAQLRWRVELDFDALPEPVPGPTYFPQDIIALRPDECFVDCGAFDGDTLSDLVRLSSGRFQKVWALEPDPTNFVKLEQVVAGLAVDLQQRITLLPAAVSDRTGKLRFSADARASSAVTDQGGIEVAGLSLDALLADSEPTFIKMDIEGAELSALQGLRGVLGRRRPALAICSYHLQEHLWEIPLWLRSVLTDYDFYLRSHDREGWDLVCYAVPRERARTLSGRAAGGERE